MFKRNAVLVLGVVLALTITGCSGGSSGAPTPAAASNPAYDESYESSVSEEVEISENAADARMIIKNAYLEIESDDSAALYDNVIVQVKKLGGYESSYNIDNFETYSVIHAEIRIPADKFDEIIGYIKKTGTVINNRMSTEDITEDYFDVKTRLETRRATLQTYYGLLEKASTVEEIIQLQRTIDDITVELEAMEGRLRLWSTQVSMSTVEMLIRQNNDPVKIRKDINWNTLTLDDMGYLITRGFTTTLDYIAVMAQWLVIAAVSLSPLIALVAVVYFVLKKTTWFKWFKLKLPRIKKRPSRKRKAKKDEADISESKSESE